jgi:hypothetical protein
MRAEVLFVDQLDHTRFRWRVEARVRRWFRWRTSVYFLEGNPATLYRRDGVPTDHREGLLISSALVAWNKAQAAHERALAFEELELSSAPKLEQTEKDT